jgi:hypothetical protein
MAKFQMAKTLLAEHFNYICWITLGEIEARRRPFKCRIYQLSA